MMKSKNKKHNARDVKRLKTKSLSSVKKKKAASIRRLRYLLEAERRKNKALKARLKASSKARKRSSRAAVRARRKARAYAVGRKRKDRLAARRAKHIEGTKRIPETSWDIEQARAAMPRNYTKAVLVSDKGDKFFLTYHSETGKKNMISKLMASYGFTDYEIKNVKSHKYTRYLQNEE